jgi:dethiobiotin synthetase
VVVEGVGGWRVPLNAEEDVADLALKLKLQVLQVIGLRLDCMNHACLTEESMIASGDNIGGWIANWLVPDLPYGAEVMASLECELGQKALGDLVFRTAQATEPCLDNDRCDRDESCA